MRGVDALPPLPQMSSLWPEVRQARTILAARFSGSSKPAKAGASQCIFNRLSNCVMREING